jgi:hypothetical protein
VEENLREAARDAPALPPFSEKTKLARASAWQIVPWRNSDKKNKRSDSLYDNFCVKIDKDNY